jgi:AcrR family transcriptional regulator
MTNVRVEDIAAAAGVSPRTYHNYFSSREEAICRLGWERARRVAAALRDRPRDEPLAEAVTAAFLAGYGEGIQPEKPTIRLITSEPTLRGEFLKTFTAIEAPLAEAIAARTGADPEQDLAPRVLAAAAVAAARVATEYWLRPGATAGFPDILRVALATTLAGAPTSRVPIARALPAVHTGASAC